MGKMVHGTWQVTKQEGEDVVELRGDNLSFLVFKINKEETNILGNLKNGKSIKPYEPIWRTKNGRQIFLTLEAGGSAYWQIV